jgi:UDP:flavonoid glycosyltransferase YjiC (YdhE family)
MAKVLIVSMPFAGHVGPMSTLAAELIRRGHEVTASTGKKHRQRFTAIDTTWLPWARATDFDDADLAATFPKIGDSKAFRGDQATIA